ncbi:MAG: peptidylprolyl isomerase [Deltaproteobacteria bacterium]|nr:MAG: peptidylprolyl isomerase [Deltaproteobacteria bacterium]
MLAGPEVQARIVDRIVAVVNDEIITLSELRETALDDVDGKESLERLIDRKLIEQEAKRFSIEGSEQEIIFKLIRIKFQSQVEVSEEDVIDFYSHNPLFQKREEIWVQQIFFPVSFTSDQGEWEEAHEKALKIYQRIKQGADFRVLVEKYSQGWVDRNGDDLGWVRRGTLLPAFELAAFSLEAGQVSKPIRTPMGYHIIKVRDRREGEAEAFERVKERIREYLFQEKAEKLFRQWLQKLKDDSLIERKL